MTCPACHHEHKTNRADDELCPSCQIEQDEANEYRRNHR